MVRFSIIIPVYNVAPWLRECLDSVSAQTFQDWEAICVDDGSADGGGSILDEYADRDNRIRVIHQRNAGVSAARNAGLERVTGQWVLFLDGDDVIEHSALRKISECIDAVGGADIVSFGTTDFEDGKEVRWPKKHSLVSRVTDISTSVSDPRLCWHFAGKAYRYEVVRSVRFERALHGEDMIFSLQCLELASKEVRIDESFYGYRMRAGSATSRRFSLADYEDILLTAMKVLRLCRKSAKRLPIEVYERQVVGLLKRTSFCACKMTPDDRMKFAKVWFSVAGEFCRGIVSLRQYWILARVCCSFEKWFLVELLWAYPYVVCSGIRRLTSRLVDRV